ncbi:hypothetical protein [Stenomitos frigidus]|uniref:Uncharacterized protein n=1 Tax=Stenomitos frigidus ULC18 TaxID=2107698 RepID=A0A2T1EBS0_9CYAN|nr:hypothetical protein [Stenomitos frigidus]PSB30154.1 hypothetical protein C7B82_09360 [Stenomitos frigidus ULC18]
MQPTTLKLKPTTFRPGRVVATVLAMLLLAAAMSWFYHPIMVKLHGGVWCMRAYPAGHQEFLYGGACNR